MTQFPQPSFAAGEVSPALAARVDLSKRAVAAELMENFIPSFTGSADNRNGSQFVARCKGTGTTRVLPFEFNADQTFILELGETYMRFHAAGSQILDSNSASTISGITQADPAVVTTSGAHGLTSSDEVYISGIVGMRELNGRNLLVTVLTGTTFSVQDLDGADVDSSAYTAWSSAGTVYPVYEVTTPWAAADLSDIRYSQSADVMTLVHPDYAPQELVRIANDNWTLGDVAFVPTQDHPTNTTGECKTTVETFTVSAATAADPVVITTADAHTYVTGDIVHINGVGGMVELNHFLYTITSLTGHKFSLQHVDLGTDIDGTGFTAFTSGGTVTTAVEPRQYTITAVSADTGEESLHGTNNGNSATITNVTQADPAVVTTSAGHGLRDLDEVELNSIVGMTELNDSRFEVLYIDNTSFSLKYLTGDNVDSTAFTAYSSAGTATFLHAEVVSSADSDWNNLVQWTSVSGAAFYNIYSTSTLGTFGYIGSTSKDRFQDRNLDPDTSTTPPHEYLPFNDPLDTGNYHPGAVGFHQQRRVFGNTDDAPNRMYFSQTANIYNFSRSSPSRDTDAFNVGILARRVNEVKHLVPLSDLIAFTSGAEYRIGSVNGSALAPSTVQVTPQSYYGSLDLPPLVSGRAALFMSPGNYVRDMNYQFSDDKYVSRDMTVLARHLFDDKTIVDWDYASAPSSLIWICRSDGVALTMTYQQEQDVYAWARQTTSGSYKSVAVIREDNSDNPYFVVERSINGTTKQFVERTLPRCCDDIQDATFLDAYLSLNVPFTITGATAADPIVVTTSSAHGFSNGDTVDIAGLMAADTYANSGEALSSEYNGVGYTVANKTSTTFELSGIDGSAYAAYSSGGKVRKAVTTVSGLWHLDGATVVAAANGVPVTSLTVTDGSITLPSAASRVHIGLPYVSRLTSLATDFYERGQSSKGRHVNSTRATVEVLKSRGLWYGPAYSLLREASFDAAATGKAPELTTADIEVTLKADWDRKKRIFIEQRDPMPLTVLSLTPDLAVGGL